MKKVLSIFLSLSLCISTSNASIYKNMESFFGKFGAATNSTEGSSFKDQSGGYYNGGSLFVRMPTRNTNLVSATPPGFRMGCGGIDVWTGGFSYINGAQLKDSMKAIVSGMPAYAMMLAVETYAPQLHNIMQQLNKMAADFNRMNINSCETSAAMVGSIWPKSDLGSQAACRMMASNDGAASDWVKARHECGQSRDHGATDERRAQHFVGEFNLAWKVLEKISFDFTSTGTDLNPFGDDEAMSSSETQTLKEIMMTLSGTIINRKSTADANVYEKKTLPSKGDQDSFLKSLMSGGKITYYKCDDAKCLRPTIASLDLRVDKALQTKVTKILESIVTKIHDDNGDVEPTAAEMSLVNATALPVYKFINVTTAFQKGHAPLSIAEYGELIAFDIVYKYVDDVLTAFREATQSLQAQAFNDEDIKPFLDGIERTRGNLMQSRGAAFKRMDQLLGFVQKTQMIEKHLQGMMGMMPNEYGI